MQPSVSVRTNLLGIRNLTYSVLKFSGGEIQVRFNSIDRYEKRDLRGAYVSLETNITSSDILMEVLLVTDALRRLNLDLKISLTTKYFPYARQDRVCYPGESLSVKVMADIINSQNYDRVTVWDAHSDVTPALLNNVKNIECVSLVGNVLHTLEKRKNTILVSPDAGATKKVMKVAQAYKMSMVTAEKVRDTNTGAILSTKVDIPFEHIDKKDFLIVDDICDGGRTFIELAKVLRPLTKGKIELYVTHGIFSQGFDVFKDVIDYFWVANPLYSYNETEIPFNMSIVG